MLAGCAVTADKRTPGPAEIPIATATTLRIPGTLLFVPAEETVRLMRAMNERPGAEVLGAVLNQDAQRPLMMVIFAASRDARGVPRIELVGWDDAPAAKALIEQYLLAQAGGPSLPHPSTLTPPPQPPVQLAPPPPPTKNQVTKDGKPQKLCMRDTLVPCPDERSRSCTRKELVACD